jgi:hypothetical protein
MLHALIVSRGLFSHGLLPPAAGQLDVFFRLVPGNPHWQLLPHHTAVWCTALSGLIFVHCHVHDA